MCLEGSVGRSTYGQTHQCHLWTRLTLLGGPSPSGNDITPFGVHAIVNSGKPSGVTMSQAV